MKKLLSLLLVLIICSSCTQEKEIVALSDNEQHPKLILTAKGVKDIRSKLGAIPIFDNSLQKVKEEVDTEIALGIKTPIPLDYSGGYTHSRHKKNWFILQKAGVLYQILDDEKYAKYVKDMLMQYEAMYKTLPLHPKTRSYARGKLFWQCLNDSNWLVYVSQAYDCIYNYLSEEERNKLETNLFKPFADHISIDSPQFYQRVHNHSTWGNAAVGMIGLVMDDEDLIQRALYGVKGKEMDKTAKDDDGGFINKSGKAGFLANIEEPFSPEGYYNEGPYYQRYAMYPFLIFAEALHNVKPELKIFEYKEGVLLKSINALLNLSDADGDFFPLNDGQKGMSYYNDALVTAVDISYHFGGGDAGLLSISEKQNSVLLDDSGLAVALGIKEGKVKPFDKKSINLSDGPEGKQGGVGILRNEDIELVFKYASQGSSHGHYDKLSYSLYENGEEVIQDYGLARFVNIEQKGGGNYLKENKTWAKQTIAHNTVTQNETSHYQGQYEIGSQNHPEKYIFNAFNPNFQIVSAKEKNAYPGTEMHRTMIMVKDKDLEKPFIVDINKIQSNKKNQYDLPFHYFGQIISTSFKYESPNILSTLGSEYGYQHLWKEGSGIANAESIQFTWLDRRRFYTITAATNKNDEIIFARIGANDPEFNLRKEPSIIIRKKNTQNTVYASIIESHGTYNPIKEVANNAYSNFSKIEVIKDDANYTAIKIKFKNGKEKLIILSNNDRNKTKEHAISINNKIYKWAGSYYYE
tara:strand:+ start:33726 stop:35972 length:2247 start_codon:yes stop_codon:yes gene_type:complete